MQKSGLILRTQLPSDSPPASMSGHKIGYGTRGRWALVLATLLSPFASCTEAYLQDRPLETALRRSDPQVLSLLPAKGYKDGAAGFFRDHDLYVVPDTERAWCNDKPLGVLPPGCYIELRFQQRGRKARASDGVPCGLLGRWHRAPRSSAYKPTPGAYYSLAIANGSHDEVIMAFEERSPSVNLKQFRQMNECDEPSSR
jgi:hypothetical protein